MTILNSSWQLIAQSSGFSWGYGTEYIQLFAWAEENISGNYSTVHTLLRVHITNGTLSVSNWNAGVDGSSGTSGGYTTFSGDTDILQGSYTVGHNADGTGAVSIGTVFDSTYGITHWDWRDTVGLQTIPRTSPASLSTGSVTLDGSSGVTIYTNRKSSSFNHVIQHNFSGSFETIASNVGDSYKWVPPASYYNVIANGSKKFTIRCITYNGGAQIGYVDNDFNINSAGADAVSLSNTNMTMGNDYTVNISKKVDSFRHTISWGFGTAAGTLGTAKAVDTSVAWTPDTDLSVQIPNSMTGQGSVTCQTYYGDTLIGSSSVNFNLSVPAYNVVLSAPVITEEGKDNTGALLTARGVTATEVVAIMSVKALAVSASTSYNAAITNISVSFGGKTVDTSANTDKSVFNNTFAGMMNGALTITATDSRGRTLSAAYSQNYIFRPYFLPSVTAFDGDRDSQTGDTGTLHASGSCWHDTAGTTDNAVTAVISQSATGTATVTYDSSNTNNWLTSFAVSGVDANSAYDFTITITDTFGYSASKKFSLAASVPVFWKGKHTVRIKKFLIVERVIKSAKGVFSEYVQSPLFKGNLEGTATYATSAGSIPLDQRWPIGSVYFQVGTTASPASILGGTWAALAGDWRMILAGPASSGNNWTGGSLTTNDTTLTANQSGLRVHDHTTGGANIGGTSSAVAAAGGSFWVPTGDIVGVTVNANGGWNAADGHHHGMDWQPYITVTAWKRTA